MKLLMILLMGVLTYQLWIHPPQSFPVSQAPPVSAAAPHPTEGWRMLNEPEYTLPAGLQARVSVRPADEISARVPGAYAYQTYDADGGCLLVLPPTRVSYDSARGYAHFTGIYEGDTVAHELLHCALGYWHGDVALQRALHPDHIEWRFPEWPPSFENWLWYYQSLREETKRKRRWITKNESKRN